MERPSPAAPNASAKTISRSRKNSTTKKTDSTVTVTNSLCSDQERDHLLHARRILQASAEAAKAVPVGPLLLVQHLRHRVGAHLVKVLGRRDSQARGCRFDGGLFHRMGDRTRPRASEILIPAERPAQRVAWLLGQALCDPVKSPTNRRPWARPMNRCCWTK